ncbi:hypothetical protein CVU37_02055 [candidate division BRC1 bacterium HGW-BRC1-1]|jgi:hypothetical protein|nr:MAG: hypothetical protein CVU37_02055 [candidate division BRC1 bacterium HGW-BRC1-1]
MFKVLAISLNTFKEAVRNKVLYFLLIFAILIIVFSSFISDLSIAAPDRLIKDLGLASIDFFGFLIAVFVGVYLVYNELDKKTIYTIVSKPIDRYQFILGKYFGLLITILVNMVIMSIFLFAVLYWRETFASDKLSNLLYPEVSSGKREAIANLQLHYYWFHVQTFFIAIGKAVATLFGYSEAVTAGLLRVIAFSALGLSIITAFAIFYSTFSTPTLSAVFTSLTFVIGSLSEDIVRYAEKLAEKAGGLAALAGADVLKYNFATWAVQIVPNLAYFDKRAEAIHGPAAMEVPAILGPTLSDPWAVAYGLLYTAGILCLASLIFNRRNFK